MFFFYRKSKQCLAVCYEIVSIIPQSIKGTSETHLVEWLDFSVLRRGSLIRSNPISTPGSEGQGPISIILHHPEVWTERKDMDWSQ